jgi:hypothetical protein
LTDILQVSAPTGAGALAIDCKHMPRKKKPKPFRAVKAVKEMARERIGAPKAEQVVPHKKNAPDKHKPTLGELLQEE